MLYIQLAEVWHIYTKDIETFYEGQKCAFEINYYATLSMHWITFSRGSTVHNIYQVQFRRWLWGSHPEYWHLKKERASKCPVLRQEFQNLCKCYFERIYSPVLNNGTAHAKMSCQDCNVVLCIVRLYEQVHLEIYVGPFRPVWHRRPRCHDARRGNTYLCESAQTRWWRVPMLCQQSIRNGPIK